MSECCFFFNDFFENFEGVLSLNSAKVSGINREMISGWVRDVYGAFALASALCGSKKPQNFTEITRPTVKSLTVPLLTLAGR